MTALRLGALVVLILVAAGTPVTLTMEATPVPVVTPMIVPGELAYPPDAEIHGASLGEWHGRYWQWVTSFPSGENPAQDPSGERCGYGQHDPVFFVPRNLPPCAAPANTAIFLPIAGTACMTAEATGLHGQKTDELEACAAADAERYSHISVRVNGEAIPGIEEFRAASPVFPVQLPENNILAVPAGAGWVVADGYAVVLAPLPPGEHEIVVHVEVVDGYALPDETLLLTVAEPGPEDAPFGAAGGSGAASQQLFVPQRLGRHSASKTVVIGASIRGVAEVNPWMEMPAAHG